MDDIAQLALIGATVMLSGYIQGVTGFGFGIAAMVFLPSVMAYTEASALSSILGALSSLYIAFVMRRSVSWKNLIYPLAGCCLSTYAAVAFVKTQSSGTMTLLLGIALLLLSAYFFFFSERIKIRPTWYAGLTAGVISGVMGGIFSIGGPPVVIYFLQSEDSSDKYVSTISAYFVLSGVVTVVSKAAAGFVTESVLVGVAVGLLCMLLGSFLGKKTGERIRTGMLRKAVYGFMGVSGAVNILTSLI